MDNVAKIQKLYREYKIWEAFDEDPMYLYLNLEDGSNSIEFEEDFAYVLEPKKRKKTVNFIYTKNSENRISEYLKKIGCEVYTTLEKSVIESLKYDNWAVDKLSAYEYGSEYYYRAKEALNTKGKENKNKRKLLNKLDNGLTLKYTTWDKLEPEEIRDIQKLIEDWETWYRDNNGKNSVAKWSTLREFKRKIKHRENLNKFEHVITLLYSDAGLEAYSITNAITENFVVLTEGKYRLKGFNGANKILHYKEIEYWTKRFSNENIKFAGGNAGGFTPKLIEAKESLRPYMKLDTYVAENPVKKVDNQRGGLF